MTDETTTGTEAPDTTPPTEPPPEEPDTEGEKYEGGDIPPAPENGEE